MGNGIKGDPGKFMASLLNERKRNKCVCMCVCVLSLTPLSTIFQSYHYNGVLNVTLLSIHIEFKFLFFFTFLEVQRVEHCRTVPDTVLMKHITVRFFNHHKDHYNI